MKKFLLILLLGLTLFSCREEPEKIRLLLDSGQVVQLHDAMDLASQSDTLIIQKGSRTTIYGIYNGKKLPNDYGYVQYYKAIVIKDSIHEKRD